MDLIDSFKTKLEELDNSVVVCTSEDEVDAVICEFLSDPLTLKVIDRCNSEDVFYDAVRKLARDTMKQLYRHSALLNHAIEKPFGYAGDYCLFR